MEVSVPGVVLCNSGSFPQELHSPVSLGTMDLKYKHHTLGRPQEAIGEEYPHDIEAGKHFQAGHNTNHKYNKNKDSCTLKTLLIR